MRKKTTVAFIGLLLFALTAIAQNKPDFSGTWVLNKSKSTFEFKPFDGMERGVVVIEHREQVFKFRRSYVYGGQADEASFEHRTDGLETKGQEGRWEAFYSMRWEGDVLTRLIRLQTSRGEALNTFRYSLLEEGKVLRIEEKYKGPLQTLNNLWIFDRQ